MRQIKILAVATAIMQVTRSFDLDRDKKVKNSFDQEKEKKEKKEKRYIKRFCDKCLFKRKLKEDQNEEYLNLIDYHLKNIDP